MYGITSNSLSQGKMPLLVDLQAISISDNVDYEVILVNRLIDPELQELERRVFALASECPDFAPGQVSSDLTQKIANIVVEQMGGPVENADEALRRWMLRSYELRNSLNTTILPLGRVNVGLARHRALLFKVYNKSSYLFLALVLNLLVILFGDSSGNTHYFLFHR